MEGESTPNTRIMAKNMMKVVEHPAKRNQRNQRHKKVQRKPWTLGHEHC